jgi:hypothetical protein
MTCRDEILSCVRDLSRNKSDSYFTVQEVLDEMNRRGTKYEESTIRTHITSRMCKNAKKHHAVKFDDFERVAHGLYRLFSNREV